MSQEAQKFVIADPRTFDGTPYEVAGRSVAQLRGLVKLIELSTPAAEAMVRNAQMSREIEENVAPTPWERTPQGRVFMKLRTQTEETIKALDALERAASYDPKHPPRA
jgi:hypothetical protein